MKGILKMMTKTKSLPFIPTIGTGVTIASGSDRHPGTIVEVTESGHTITFVYDLYRVISGTTQDGSAEYEITPSDVNDFTKGRFTARWSSKYKTYMYGGQVIGVGHRDAYYDPHF